MAAGVMMTNDYTTVKRSDAADSSLWSSLLERRGRTLSNMANEQQSACAMPASGSSPRKVYCRFRSVDIKPEAAVWGETNSLSLTD
jgi:hypothetical protein